jgi:hypothetical protein
LERLRTLRWKAGGREVSARHRAGGRRPGLAIPWHRCVAWSADACLEVCKAIGLAIMDGKAETTTSKGAEKFSKWRAFVLWPFVFLMMYFLSAGPAFRIANKYPDCPGDVAMNLLYYPWFALYSETPMHKPLGLYMHLWMPEAFDKDGEFHFHFLK